MAQYAVKILIDVEALDDIQAKSLCKQLMQKPLKDLGPQVREITVRDMTTFKSLKLAPDGTPQGTWRKA
ncbi:MAG: hypothetical protein ACREJ2_11805 [Planctomycetota bacterium]